MKVSKVLAAVAVGCFSAYVASAYPISLNVFATEGVWTDSFGSTPVPQGSWYQVFWSSDAAYGGNTINATDAAVANGATSFGDYVLFSGTLTTDGGWTDPVATGTLGNANVGGATISSGFVYANVYYSVADPLTPPADGDLYARSRIYGPNAAGLNPTEGTSVIWGDPTKDPPDQPDTIDMSPNAGGEPVGSIAQFMVVPEPGTMALFGVGLITLAARRRRK